jgi:branched-subunit amino acid aminotransferase/4-amino-4-deoxychorismate lyase
VSTLLIDGFPPTQADLHYLAMVNYGAYTAFRVEDGGVRGFDLHLSRLDAYAVELFGEPVGEDRLRGIIRTAVENRCDAWVRVNLFSPGILARTPSACVRPKVMTSVSPPPPPLATRVRLRIQTYGRDDAHIKHTATLGLIRARRLAREAGFDDALFADVDGLISEGSSWNIGFLRGDHLVWPQAPMLHDLSRFDGAFICNSTTPACPVTAIGDRVFAIDASQIERIASAWLSQPAEPI